MLFVFLIIREIIVYWNNTTGKKLSESIFKFIKYLKSI